MKLKPGITIESVINRAFDDIQTACNKAQRNLTAIKTYEQDMPEPGSPADRAVKDLETVKGIAEEFESRYLKDLSREGEVAA